MLKLKLKSFILKKRKQASIACFANTFLSTFKNKIHIARLPNPAKYESQMTC
jgi:hypothetical protein